jgi:hypothetical protein
MLRTTRITGQFVRSDGKPLSYSELEVRGGDGAWNLQADHEGRVEGEVPRGIQALRLRSHWAPDWTRDGVPEAGAILDLGEVRVTAGAALSGRVVSPAGGSVAQAVVSLAGKSSNADEHGNFVLENVPPGTHELQAHGPRSVVGVAPDQVKMEVVVPGAGVLVRLSSARFLELGFRQSGGVTKLETDVRVIFRTPTGAIAFGRTIYSKGHRLRCRGPQAGTYGLEINVPDHEPVVIEQVVVSDAGPVSYDVLLTRSGD